MFLPTDIVQHIFKVCPPHKESGPDICFWSVTLSSKFSLSLMVEFLTRKATIELSGAKLGVFRLSSALKVELKLDSRFYLWTRSVR